MSTRPQDDRNQEATVYLGNLDERVSDAIVWELMLQAGPVVNVHLPKDRISMTHQGYGFCEFLTEEDAEYACKIMNQIKLWGKPIRVNKASSDKKQLDIGANLFIGNLDTAVDERLLYDTFSVFGPLTQAAKVARDPTTMQSKGMPMNVPPPPPGFNAVYPPPPPGFGAPMMMPPQ
ncbi:Splicing factor 3B subunit 4 [Serendipita sp. 396]|nr:Splicing factor 3B subunit 4 [Serendipita sp. 396]